MIWTSPDGLRWSPFRNSDRPLLSKGHYDTQNQIFWDSEQRKYVAYVRRWNPPPDVSPAAKTSPLCCRRVGRAETTNLESWPEPEIVFGLDGDDPLESDVYNSSIVKYPLAKSLYFMFPSLYFHIPQNRNRGPLDIHLAASRNGVDWNRAQRTPYVRLGPAGSFDAGSLYMCVGMLHQGPEIWMYYIAHDYLHGDHAGRTYSGVISRLVQRVDGFVSADSAYTGGELTTVPFVCQGQQLKVNVDTSALGAFQVEILDERGKSIPEFSLLEADPLIGNFVDRIVSWSGNQNISALAGRIVKLRFVTRDAKFYSFRFVR